MKNIIGHPARGTDFFKREAEVTKISSRLSNGNNIQIAAPRRVGKTSILWYLLDNDIENRNYVYIDTESVEEEQDFYKKLLTEILRNPKIQGSKKLHEKLSDGTHKIFRKIRSVKAFGGGVEFNHDENTKDYFEELSNFLVGYAQEETTELIILIDEFPQTIENIKKIDEKSAINFLQKNRELRLNPGLNGKVKFIYTGSIGLNHTVTKLGATAYINDISSIEIPPLNEAEAKELFKKLLEPREVTEVAEQKMLEKLQWFIPFHIQLVVQEIIDLTTPKQIIDDAIVEKAIDNIIQYKNQHHFEHYNTRLKSQFKDSQLAYANDVLQQLALKGAMTKIEVFDLAIKYKVDNECRLIIETLIYDGYINLNQETNYQFNSPILKLWWVKFICK